jgi:hypothetical protein
MTYIFKYGISRVMLYAKSVSMLCLKVKYMRLFSETNYSSEVNWLQLALQVEKVGLNISILINN